MTKKLINPIESIVEKQSMKRREAIIMRERPALRRCEQGPPISHRPTRRSIPRLAELESLPMTKVFSTAPGSAFSPGRLLFVDLRRSSARARFLPCRVRSRFVTWWGLKVWPLRSGVGCLRVDGCRAGPRLMVVVLFVFWSITNLQLESSHLQY